MLPDGYSSFAGLSSPREHSDMASRISAGPGDHVDFSATKSEFQSSKSTGKRKREASPSLCTRSRQCAPGPSVADASVIDASPNHRALQTEALPSVPADRRTSVPDRFSSTRARRPKQISSTLGEMDHDMIGIIKEHVTINDDGADGKAAAMWQLVVEDRVRVNTIVTDDHAKVMAPLYDMLARSVEKLVPTPDQQDDSVSDESTLLAVAPSASTNSKDRRNVLKPSTDKKPAAGHKKSAKKISSDHSILNVEPSGAPTAITNRKDPTKSASRKKQDESQTASKMKKEKKRKASADLESSATSSKKQRKAPPTLKTATRDPPTAVPKSPESHPTKICLTFKRC